MNDEKTWQLTKKVYPVTIRLTAPIYDAMLRIIETGAYLNPSEYINDMLQQHFKERGIELEAITLIDEEGEDKVSVKDMLLYTAVVNARLPIPMKNAVDQVLDSGLYFNVSHYIRDVVRKDLESREISLE